MKGTRASFPANGKIDWKDYSACQPVDTPLFFSDDELDQSVAKAICAECTVKQFCLAYALRNNIEYGIYGGLNPKDRRRKQRNNMIQHEMKY